MLNHNLLIIPTTMPNNLISESRRNNIINNFSKYNIPVMFNYGIKQQPDIDNRDITFHTIKSSIELYKKTNFEYAIICDDDFFPIDNFLEELNKTIELLPDNWRCLHLCPGYLWGRKFKDSSKIGCLNPEYDMKGIDFDSSGRFYINCNNRTYFKKKILARRTCCFYIE